MKTNLQFQCTREGFQCTLVFIGALIYFFSKTSPIGQDSNIMRDECIRIHTLGMCKGQLARLW